MHVVLSLMLAAVAGDPAPLGLPEAAALKESCGIDDAQVKKVEAIYAEYKDKVAEAQKKVKEAQDKKAASQDLRTLRSEIAGKVKDVGKDDAQKAKLTEACALKEKKK